MDVCVVQLTYEHGVVAERHQGQVDDEIRQMMHRWNNQLVCILKSSSALSYNAEETCLSQCLTSSSESYHSRQRRGSYRSASHDAAITQLRGAENRARPFCCGAAAAHCKCRSTQAQ